MSFFSSLLPPPQILYLLLLSHWRVLHSGFTVPSLTDSSTFSELRRNYLLQESESRRMGRGKGCDRKTFCTAGLSWSFHGACVMRNPLPGLSYALASAASTCSASSRLTGGSTSAKLSLQCFPVPLPAKVVEQAELLPCFWVLITQVKVGNLKPRICTDRNILHWKNMNWVVCGQVFAARVP